MLVLMRTPHPQLGAWTKALIGLLALGLGSCRPPAPQPPAAHPAQGGGLGPAKPQFTFASWSAAKSLIRGGQVVQLVSGRAGGYSLILQDRTWVHLVAKPGDPLPGNPMEYINKNAPNAKAIRHSVE
jgi:hypothetical protein